jgi:hypothetical protein
MEHLLWQERQPRFIGTLESLEMGWRASFRLRVLNEVFAQQGGTNVFTSELDALKWLHTEAAERGFSSIEIQHRS